MKLKELLQVIPDDYYIGLADFSKDNCTITYGTKEDSIGSFARKERFTTEQVDNMEVIAIHPCATIYGTEEHLYGDDMPSLHVKTQLLIEIM